MNNNKRQKVYRHFILIKGHAHAAPTTKLYLRHPTPTPSPLWKISGFAHEYIDLTMNYDKMQKLGICEYFYKLMH